PVAGCRRIRALVALPCAGRGDARGDRRGHPAGLTRLRMRASLPPAARSLLAGFADLVFAPVCLGCGSLVPAIASERRLCGACRTRLRELPRPRCPRCDSPRPPTVSAALAREGCSTCELLPPAVRSLRSAFVLEGPAHRLVHGLKYGGWHCLASLMGGRMAAVWLGRETEEEVEMLVPVPLSGVRMRQRGYNQPGLLAEVVCQIRGLQCR